MINYWIISIIIKKRKILLEHYFIINFFIMIVGSYGARKYAFEQ